MSIEKYSNKIHKLDFDFLDNMSERELILKITKKINLSALYTHKRFFLTISKNKISKMMAYSLIKEIDYFLCELSSLLIRITVVCKKSGKIYCRA